MYSNNIVNFQESRTILDICTKTVWKLIECTTHVHVYKPHHHHHHHVALPVRIFLTLSRHLSPSSIAPGRSSWLHRHRAGRPIFSHPCEGVHKSMPLMSLSLLLQLCPHMSGSSNLDSFHNEWQVAYGCCFVGCRFQDFFNIASRILNCRQSFSPYV